MKKILLLLLLIAAPVAAQQIAITNVNVIPMDRERVLEDHVVLVSNGKITAVGPRVQTRIPAGTRMIDGGGGYLLPGLSDFHVHMRLRGDLGAYVAHGVTALADMGGPGAQMRAWRDSIRAGRMTGPDIYVGYFVDGPGQRGGVATVEEARAAARAADSLRFDFIKVYNSLTAEQYDAIMEEAKRAGIAVVGHGVRSIGLERGFAAGQSMVVHGEEYMYTELRGRISDEHIPEVVAFTRKHGAYVLPNLSAFEAMTLQWGKPEVLEQFLARPEARYMPKYWVDNWRGRDYVRRTGSIAARHEFLKHLTLALQRAEVPLLTGTDSPGIPGMFAGSSLHDDLRVLVEAGLTPYQALVASTRNAGEYARKHLRSRESFGVIAPGYRADFVLAAANPLQDIARLRQPKAVMVRGKWLNAEDLEKLLLDWGK